MKKTLTYRERKNLEDENEEIYTRDKRILNYALAVLATATIGWFGEGILNNLGAQENKRAAKSAEIRLVNQNRLEQDLIGAGYVVDETIGNITKKGLNYLEGLTKKAKEIGSNIAYEVKNTHLK